jgi:membrane protease YdiL (CAAX protease family)
MNRLQKSAWFNLLVVTVLFPIASLGLFLLARTNAKGVDYLIIFLVLGSLAGLGGYLLLRKKGFEAHFDEREKMIYKRAFEWSMIALLAFLGCVCFIPFFVVGGGNFVRVLYLPVIFLSTLFVAQFVHSASILILCALEAEDEQ